MRPRPVRIQFRPGPHKELAVLRAFVANQVDAIVLAALALTVQEYVTEITPVLSRFEENGGVVVGITEQSYPIHRLRFDHIAGLRQAMQHLIEHGHRRIAYLAGPTNLDVSAVRFDGYRKSLEEHGLEYEPDLVECGWFPMEGGAQATATLMERESFTAIVAANDLIGALRTLRDRRLFPKMCQVWASTTSSALPMPRSRSPRCTCLWPSWAGPRPSWSSTS